MYSIFALEKINRLTSGLPQLKNATHQINPVAFLQLIARSVNRSDQARYFRGDLDHNALVERLLHEYDCNGFTVILDRLAEATLIGGASAKTAFWAFALSEAKFSDRFMPFASHEERATGFLLASLMSDLSTAMKKQNRFNPGGMNEAFEFGFFDTAAEKNEAHTGSDIGIIIRSGVAGKTIVKAARIQVKISKRRGGACAFRVSNNVPAKILKENFLQIKEQENTNNPLMFARRRLRFHQLDRLCDVPHLGYYAVFDLPNIADETAGFALPPLVVSAITVRNLARRSGRATLNLLDRELGAIPLSAFLGLGLTTQASGWGWQDQQRVRDGEFKKVFTAAAKLFENGSPPRYALFVDVSAEPFRRDFRKRWSEVIAASVRGSISGKHMSDEPQRSRWTDFDDSGEPVFN